MQAALVRWMHDFQVDGIRMDSVENVFSWDFIGEYRHLARSALRDACPPARRPRRPIPGRR